MANDICGWSKVASTKTKPLLALAMFAVCALAWGQSDRTGTLTAPARFPLIMDGKQVGSSTAAAGTKVTILKEEGGKLLVSGPAGQTWLASEMVTPSSPPTENPAAARPSEPPEHAKKEVASPTPVPDKNRAKKVLFVARDRFNQSERAIVESLKEAGVDVKIAGRAGHNIGPWTYAEPEGNTPWFVHADSRGGSWDKSAPAIIPDVAIGPPGADPKPATTLLTPELIAGFDGFIFGDYNKDESGLGLILRASSKPVVCGESLPPAKNADAAHDAPPPSVAETPGRLYYRIYNRDARDQSGKGQNAQKPPAPDDAEMKKFVSGILVPKIKKTIESPSSVRASPPCSVFQVTAWDIPVTVLRVGSGSKGIVFFDNSANNMATELLDSLDSYTSLVQQGFSLFLFKFPINEMIRISQNNIKPGGSRRYDFTGFASQIVAGIREAAKINQFCLVGNSFGAGVILWDFDALAKDPGTKFVFVSPTPDFMPDILESTKLLPRTVLVSLKGDHFFPTENMPAIFKANLSSKSAKYEGRGHLIVGQNLSHDEFRDLIRP